MKEQIVKDLSENKRRLQDGSFINKLGQGTWCMGEDSSHYESEKQAIREGISYGMTLIDTAEMYGSGRSELLIGEAISDIPRHDLYLVSKVYPYNAGKDHIFKSCDDSLKRLGTDYLDLYLLHWRGSVPLIETVTCMEELVHTGKIRRWGVSNFDVSDIEELLRVPRGENCMVNQVLYHLGSRGIEYSLLPLLKDHGITPMAYSPLAQAGSLKQKLLQSKNLKKTAEKHEATIMQILLAFVMRNPDIIVIPKSGKKEHVILNANASQIKLDETDLNLLSEEFPAPTRKLYLDMC